MKKSTKRSRRDIIPDENQTPALKDLPEELIHHILCFLPDEKDAICSSLLSKAWFRAWSTKPHLKFDHEICLQDLQDDVVYTNGDFLRSVDSTLARYYYGWLPVESFDLTVHTVYWYMPYRLYTWLLLVSSCGLKHLKHLSLSVRPYVSCNLPSEIFECENLHTVKISVCDVGTTTVCFLSAEPVVVKCYSLKVLELERVRISEKLMGKLLSGCRLIEKICLRSCTGLEKIKGRGFQRLQELEISSMDGVVVEIDATDLRSFVYATGWDYKHSEKPFGINIDSSKRLASLVLYGAQMEDEELNKFISKFPLLEKLTIDSNFELETIDIRSDSLRELSVSGCSNLDYVEVHTPRLRLLRFCGRRMPWFSFPTVDPHQLKAELTLSFNDDVEILHNSFFNRLKEAVLVSRNTELSVLISGFVELLVDLEELPTDPIPGNGVEDLFIQIESCQDFTSFSEIEDAFCSVCHPKSIRTWCRYHNEPELKVICKLR